MTRQGSKRHLGIRRAVFSVDTLEDRRQHHFSRPVFGALPEPKSDAGRLAGHDPSSVADEPRRKELDTTEETVHLVPTKIVAESGLKVRLEWADSHHDNLDVDK
ncbi:hypothetical protein VFPPC_16192 [Pochonia chlamydosporia 170]|uniref:Uncharacterized protein n=1 Tax=Pochonia chlamydosporia 170 TaxID=1380566 RepID=A0A179FFH0_METCM|nr:hypothetical protein VFPPC_16192 [Pochonia chlamydosporia 170]OAQ64276.2 hypothetical protein VFPPC_16192 [Pochonia chlamydosporia 170]